MKRWGILLIYLFQKGEVRSREWGSRLALFQRWRYKLYRRRIGRCYMGEGTLPVETAGAIEEFEVERSYSLTVNLTIGGDLHRHD